VLKAGGVTKKIEFSSSLIVPGHDTNSILKLNDANQNKKKQYSGSIAGSSPKLDKFMSEIKKPPPSLNK